MTERTDSSYPVTQQQCRDQRPVPVPGRRWQSPLNGACRSIGKIRPLILGCVLLSVVLLEIATDRTVHRLLLQPSADPSNTEAEALRYRNSSLRSVEFKHETRTDESPSSRLQGIRSSYTETLRNGMTPHSTDASTTIERHSNNDLLETSVLVTSSLIPSHPATYMIEQTLDSLRHLHGLSDHAPIVVTIDGLDGTNESHITRLRQYVQNLRNSTWGRSDRVTIVEAPRKMHILGNIRFGLSFVTSKYVYVIQHDFPFIRDIDHVGLIRTMEQHHDVVDNVRFNKRKTQSTGHDGGNCYAMDTPVNSVNGIHLTKSSWWSDNNHLTTKEYYNTVFHLAMENYGHEGAHLALYRPPERIMVPYAKANCIRWAQFLYGQPGDEPYLKHLNGRQGQIIADSVIEQRNKQKGQKRSIISRR